MTRPGPLQGRTAWLLALLHVLAFADRFLLAPLAGPVAATLRLGDGELGMAMGPAMIIPYVGVALLLSGKIAPQTAGLWVRRALAGSAAATALGALAPNAAVLILSRGLLGLTEAGFDVGALILLGAAPASQRPRGLALFTGSALVGKSVALSGAGLLLAGFDASRHHPIGAAAPPWRLVLASFAILSGLGVFVRMPRPDTPPPLSAQPDRNPGCPGSSRLSYLSLMIPMAAGVFASQGFTAFAPLALARRFSLSPAHVGAVLGVVLLVTGVVGSQLGGEIAARTRRVGGLVLAAPLAGALLAAVGVWRAAQPALSLCAMAALMLSLCVLAPLGLELLQRVTPHGRRGQVLGGYVSAVALIGLGGAPPLIGWLSQRLHGPGATMAAICLVVSLASAMGALGAVLLPRPEPSQLRS